MKILNILCLLWSISLLGACVYVMTAGLGLVACGLAGASFVKFTEDTKYWFKAVFHDPY